MIWIYYLLLLGTALLGILLVLLTLPGLWLITAAAALYALVTHGRFLGVKTLLALLIVSALAELFEWIIGAAAVGRAGGSAAAKRGALLGGIAGGVFLTIIPIPIVGTILGICLGAFVGASAMEWLGGKETSHSLRVGLGAAKGRLAGLLGKLIVAVAMFLAIIWTALP